MAGQNVTWLQGLRMMFYLMTPNESSFETIEEVPDYVKKHAVPYFLIFIFVESIIVTWIMNRKYPVNDVIGSMSQGLYMTMCKFFYGWIEVATYLWTYENFNIIKLDWSSPWTWWLCFLGFDFAYYLFHRYAHEINILWAAHQAHHSSEEYNLSTALRQSSLQGATSWMFYIPLAVSIPPSVYLVHRQFNLLYQFWIHTELVGKLGPLEWILNTPSHHRVHHGRNAYCLDKNYGGTLIIFDRIFGTFAPEDEPVAYGLVHPVGSFNTLYVQYFHYIHILKTAWNIEGLKNKFKVFFYGPGWFEGGGRLGDSSLVPQIKFPVKKYDPAVPMWINVYCLVHFMVVLFSFQYLGGVRDRLDYFVSLGLVVFLMYALTCFGMIFDHHKLSPLLELFRLVVTVAGDSLCAWYGVMVGLPAALHWGLRSGYIISLLIWIRVTMKNTTRAKIKTM